MDKFIKFMKYTMLLGSCAILLSSCLSIGAGRTFNRFVEEMPFDAVIVPGVPFENGEWSDVMKIRVHWAI